MPLAAAFFIFFLGAAVGSFINVVVLRLGVSPVSGRSRCPHCAKTLQWFELIPIISFLVQKGRCRSCKTRLSLQYPLVEALAGFLFLAIFWRWVWNSPVGISAEALLGSAGIWVLPLIALWWYYISALIAISVYDAKHYVIPDALLLPAIMVAIGGVVYIQTLNWIGPPFFPETGIVFSGIYALMLGDVPFGAIGSALAGILAAVGLLGALHWFSAGRAMGFGDVKLGIFMGLALGWPDILTALFIAFTAGMFWGLAAIATGKKSMKSYLPFGPFLAFGIIGAMLAGNIIVEFYFRALPRILIPV
jgi:prepilin signal peptidase PulO-like enzyme (type II secretory pathway)